MSNVRDRLWIWGHEAGSHNGAWGLPAASRMTPAEGAFYLGVPNLIMVRYHGQPAPPFDQLALSLRPLKQVVWSIVAAGGVTEAEERRHVLELAARTPNITGVMMDDFFKKPKGDGVFSTLSLDELREVRSKLAALPPKRPLDLWVVLYDHDLRLPAQAHLELCDVMTFWTWRAADLAKLESNFEAAEKLAPRPRKLLGCYMWDYGQNEPMPPDLMKRQCDLALRWLREKRIEGIIFLASCICDLGLEAVEWTRNWIAEVGDESA